MENAGCPPLLFSPARCANDETGRWQLGTEVHSGWHDRHAGQWGFEKTSYTTNYVIHGPGVSLFPPRRSQRYLSGTVDYRRLWAVDFWMPLQPKKSNPDCCNFWDRESLVLSYNFCVTQEDTETPACPNVLFPPQMFIKVNGIHLFLQRLSEWDFQFVSHYRKITTTCSKG